MQKLAAMITSSPISLKFICHRLHAQCKWSVEQASAWWVLMGITWVGAQTRANFCVNKHQMDLLKLCMCKQHDRQGSGCKAKMVMCCWAGQYSMSFNGNYTSRSSNESYETMAIDVYSAGTMFQWVRNYSQVKQEWTLLGCKIGHVLLSMLVLNKFWWELSK